MTDEKGKAILIEEIDEDSDQAMEAPEESQEIARDSGNLEAIETAGNDDDQMDKDQENPQQWRYVDKGKAKVMETGSSSRSKDDDEKEEEEEEEEEEDNVRDLKMIEELDYEYAMKLQAEEYAQAPLQQEANIPVNTLPANTPFEEAPDLEVSDADDPPVDWVPALEMSPRSWRRNLPVYCLCDSKTLTASDVDVPGAYLTLDVCSAMSMSDDFSLEDKFHACNLHKYILIYDMEDEKYNMLLTHYAANEMNVGFCLSEGWDEFVLVNRLEVGDELHIYKTYDPRVSNDHYFVIKFLRKLSLCPNLNIEYKDDNDKGDDDKTDRDKGDDNKDDEDKGANDKDDNPSKEGSRSRKLKAQPDETGGIV